MNFFEAVETGFKNYFNFERRAARAEFWYWGLFAVLGSCAAGLMDMTEFHASLSDPDAVVMLPCCWIFTLLTIVPTYAVTARRLHDMDRSGWWQLIMFVPFFGALGLAIWCTFQGTKGPNRFGPDPLEPPPTPEAV